MTTTNKTVTARAFIDRQDPANVGWAVRFANTDDASDQYDTPLDLALDADHDDVVAEVESECRMLGWTLAGVEVVR